MSAYKGQVMRKCHMCLMPYANNKGADQPVHPHFKNSVARKNLSLGFSTRYDSNQPAHLQKLARILKCWIQQVQALYYLGSGQQRHWSDCADAQADLPLCCSHMAYFVFLMTWLICGKQFLTTVIFLTTVMNVPNMSHVFRSLGWGKTQTGLLSCRC